MTGNPSIQGLGEMMVSLEMMSIKQSFFMLDDNPNHPPDFAKNNVTGIFFQNKVDYATWFGWNEAFIHGIQMLPLTPPLQKTRDAIFCSQEWNQILYDVNIADTEPVDTRKWMSVLWTGSLAIIKPQAAFDLLLNTPQTNTLDLFDSGLTKGWALYWSSVQAGVTTTTVTGTVTMSTSTVTYSSTGTVTTQTETPTMTMTNTETEGAAGGSIPQWVFIVGIGLVVVVLLALAVGVFFMMQQGSSRGEGAELTARLRLTALVVSD